MTHLGPMVLELEPIVVGTESLKEYKRNFQLHGRAYNCQRKPEKEVAAGAVGPGVRSWIRRNRRREGVPGRWISLGQRPRQREAEVLLRGQLRCCRAKRTVQAVRRQLA